MAGRIAGQNAEQYAPPGRDPAMIEFDKKIMKIYDYDPKYYYENVVLSDDEVAEMVRIGT
jgi:hypothetical protein